jgi:hypothetical protein
VHPHCRCVCVDRQVLTDLLGACMSVLPALLPSACLDRIPCGAACKPFALLFCCVVNRSAWQHWPGYCQRLLPSCPGMWCATPTCSPSLQGLWHARSCRCVDHRISYSKPAVRFMACVEIVVTGAGAISSCIYARCYGCLGCIRPAKQCVSSHQQQCHAHAYRADHVRVAVCVCVCCADV